MGLCGKSQRCIIYERRKEEEEEPEEEERKSRLRWHRACQLNICTEEQLITAI